MGLSEAQLDANFRTSTVCCRAQAQHPQPEQVVAADAAARQCPGGSELPVLACRQLDDKRKQQQVQRAFEADFLQPGDATELADSAPAAAGLQWKRFTASGAATRAFPPSLHACSYLVEQWPHSTCC